MTQAVLKRLAEPLNRGDLPAFVEAVGPPPPADRDVLAILGAGELLGPGTAREYRSRGVEADLTRWTIRFKGRHIDELTDWPMAPDARD